MSTFTDNDQQMMQRALELAERGAYTTKPNPMVGCVVVKGDAIVGEGWHQYKGQAHAEVVALQQAGDAARGATAYVTLEPCAHTGSTGPCADALIQAGVVEVIAAMRDPFPDVDGKGFERLQAAGVKVSSGLMESQARELNRGFLSRIERGRPWVRVKIASSLDGRTAMANGESKWISGEESRADVMHWRARSGALLTGSGTVLADDPSLTVRFDEPVPFVPPVRVVLDAGLATVARGKVREGDAPTLYLHADNAKIPRDFTAPHVGLKHDGVYIDLNAVLDVLARYEINDVQVEAGATLAGAFLKHKLVDEVLLYMAPILLGGEARPMFSGLGIDSMNDRIRMQIIDSKEVGEDFRVLMRPQY